MMMNLWTGDGLQLQEKELNTRLGIELYSFILGKKNMETGVKIVQLLKEPNHKP